MKPMKLCFAMFGRSPEDLQSRCFRLLNVPPAKRISIPALKSGSHVSSYTRSWWMITTVSVSDATKSLNDKIPPSTATSCFRSFGVPYFEVAFTGQKVYIRRMSKQIVKSLEIRRSVPSEASVPGS